MPDELFEQVQKRIAKNKRAPARHKAEDNYILTTKLFCGKCSAYMMGESGHSKTGKVHHYYKCITAKRRHGCDKKTVKKGWIEDVVVAQAMRMLMDDALLEQLADLVMELQAQENITLPMLRKQLAETERGIENMLDAIQQGLLNASTKKRLDDLEAAKSEIEVKILQEELQKPLLTRDQILFWLHKFRGVDISLLEHRQRLVDTFVNAVYLYDDKIVFAFNYKDGTKTVLLKDIEGSDIIAGSVPAASGGRQTRTWLC